MIIKCYILNYQTFNDNIIILNSWYPQQLDPDFANMMFWNEIMVLSIWIVKLFGFIRFN